MNESVYSNYLNGSIIQQKYDFEIRIARQFVYRDLLFSKVFFNNNNIYGKIMFMID